MERAVAKMGKGYFAWGEISGEPAWKIVRPAEGAPPAGVVKHDATSTVWAEEVDLGNGRHTIFVKHYHRRKLMGPAWDVFRGSRARRGWKRSAELLRRRVPAAAALGAVERRSWGFPVESWLITEEVRGRNVARLPGELSSFAQRRRLTLSLARWVKKLHESGVGARDLKPENLIATQVEGEDRQADALDVEIMVVDFDGMRVGKKVTERARVKDLSRLARGLMGKEVHNTDRMRFLQNYLGSGAGSAQRKRWWRMIESRVERVTIQRSRRAQSR